MRRFFVCFCFLPLLFQGCAKSRETPPEAPAEVSAPPALPRWGALAILEAGEHPLWFELTPGGPSLIDSPTRAALNPYTPWPHARFIAGALMEGEDLIMGVNQEGFLILSPGGYGSSGAPGMSGDGAGENLVLYRAEGAWNSYTIGTLFFWEDHPAAFLYRDDFFLDPKAPPLPHPVFVLRNDSPRPEAVPVPALETFPPGEGWESDSLRRSPDGFWYFRQMQKGVSRSEGFYFRTPSLARAGEGVSLSAWRNSAAPGELSSAPLLLGEVLRFFFGGLEEGGAPAALILSADFAGTAAFAAPGFGGSSGGGGITLRGCYRGKSGGLPRHGGAGAAVDGTAGAAGKAKPGEKALAIMGSGRGVYASAETPAPQAFSLPELPEGFIYTGIALVGDAAAAFWEEQEEAGIGAAGFMVIKSPF